MEKMYLKFSQNLHEVTCAGVSFLITQALSEQLHWKRDSKILFFVDSILKYEIFKIFLPFNIKEVYIRRQFTSLNIQRSIYMFEYKLPFLTFGFSNSIYIATALGCLLVILMFLLSGYKDNIFPILICCPRHLNNKRLYTPMVVKM